MLATLLLLASPSVGMRLVGRGGGDAAMWLYGAGLLWGLIAVQAAAGVWGLEALLAIASWVGRRRRPSLAAPTDAAQVRALDRRAAIARLGGGAVAVASSVPMLWGMARTRLDFEVVELPIRLPRLPRDLDGFTLVQLSDVHVGAYIGEHQLQRAEDVVRQLRPDLVVMTGDLVNVQRRWIPQATRWLARVGAHARHGATAILGNHEHYAGAGVVMQALRSAGVDVLFNDARVIAPSDGGGFGLVGVDDLSGPALSGSAGPRVGHALSMLTPDHARVLLCHQPSYLPTAAAFDFDLMLSGHTHGGQIAPFGPIFTAYAFGTSAGLARLGDTHLYVNRGFGLSGPPSRVVVRPEITKIVLVSG